MSASRSLQAMLKLRQKRVICRTPTLQILHVLVNLAWMSKTYCVLVMINYVFFKENVV